MYDWRLYYDCDTGEIFSVKFYINGLYDYENLPERFLKNINGNWYLLYGLEQEQNPSTYIHEYFDDYLDRHNCVVIGHV